jgi:F-type H+-transporting ATPase subunit gamma
MRHRPRALPADEQQDSEPRDRWGVVIFGSDQGLCGQFNEHIAEFSLNTLNGMHIRHRDRLVTVVGRRAGARIDRMGQEMETTFSVPGSVEGIVPTVQELLVRVADWRTNQQVHHILLFYNRSTSKITYEPHMVQLFPIDPDWLEQARAAEWPSRRLPVIFMDWEELFRGLNRQYFFVTLYRAMAESLASEHAARLASMQAAEQNIEEHLNEFNTAYQQQRQKVITDELLDIVSGFEALTD